MRGLILFIYYVGIYSKLNLFEPRSDNAFRGETVVTREKKVTKEYCQCFTEHYIAYLIRRTV